MTLFCALLCFFGVAFFLPDFSDPMGIVVPCGLLPDATNWRDLDFVATIVESPAFQRSLYFVTRLIGCWLAPFRLGARLERVVRVQSRPVENQPTDFAWLVHA